MEADNHKTKEIRVGTDIWRSSTQTSSPPQDSQCNRPGQNWARLAKSCRTPRMAVAQLHWVIFTCGPVTAHSVTDS